MDINNSQLPSHIIDLILSKVSIPILPNYRLVCKAWNNFILSGKLILNSKLLFAHISSHPKLYCIDFDSKSLKEGKRSIIASFTFHPRFSTFKIINSCNGLFCFVNTQSTFGRENIRQPFAIILNPMTNEYVELPLNNSLKFYPGYSYGFGFSSNTKHYKIVKLSIIRNGSYVVDIFTIGTFTRSSFGKWSRVPFMPFFVFGSNDGVYLNGCLYWHGLYRHARHRGWDMFLLRFDVESEKFQEVSFPQNGQYGAFHHSSHIWIFNNNLYLSCFNSNSKSGEFHVWKMEQDYSWIKEFVIPLPIDSVVHYHIKYYDMSSTYHFQLIKVFEDGKMLGLVSSKDLILYDPNTNHTEPLDDKLNHDGRLWIHQIDSFNFGSPRNTLGV